MIGLLLALGALVLGALAIFVLVLLAYVVYSAAAAGDVCRWLLTAQRKHPKAARKHWRHWLVSFFFREWVYFVLNGVKSITIETDLGTWYGIGRWEVRGP